MLNVVLVSLLLTLINYFPIACIFIVHALLYIDFISTFIIAIDSVTPANTRSEDKFGTLVWHRNDFSKKATNYIQG